jgi:hypothetical protein
MDICCYPSIIRTEFAGNGLIYTQYYYPYSRDVSEIDAAAANDGVSWPNFAFVLAKLT